MNMTSKCAAQVEAIRAAYLQELERFAATLRPRFESGELRGFRNGAGPHDDGDMDLKRAPVDVLTDLCAAHFGLDLEADEQGYSNAYLIRLVSPNEYDTEDDQPICGQAAIAVTYDVLSIARERRWYTPTPDEEKHYMLHPEAA